VVPPFGIVRLAKLLREEQRAAAAPFAGLLVREKTAEVTMTSLRNKRVTSFLLEVVISSALLKYLAWAPINKKPAKVLIEGGEHNEVCD
jgi:hypothetical protein